MDKYTYNLKTEKIQKLVREEDYSTAAKIADTLEWKQEHNVRLLMAVAEAYEKTGQYDSAIEVLLNVYEQAPIGKRIMYKLTELALAGGNIGDAETFYKKYLEDAPDENNRYILRYLIAEAKGEALDKRIIILETYKKYEFEEEWACRLAELYQKANRRADCVALCDQIILWFGVGPYVDRAMELKEYFEPLTASQRERRDNRAFYEAQLEAVAQEAEKASEGESGEIPDETMDDEDLPVIAISAEVAAARLDEPVKPEKKEHQVREAVAGEQKADRIQAILSRASRQMSAVPQVKEPEPIALQEEEPFTISMEEEPVPRTEEVFHVEMPEPAVIPGESVIPESPVDMEETKKLSELPKWKNLTQYYGGGDLDETREFVPQRMPEDSVPEPEPAEEALPEPEEEIPVPVPEFREETVTMPETVGEEVSAPEAGEEVPVPQPKPEATPEPGRLNIPPIPEVVAEESFMRENTGETVSSLESDSSVLPVLSFEETEQAVWEDQNRRLEELEPLESHELEHCIFISAATSEEGIDKAVEALEDYYRSREKDLPRIAKIVAEKLNRRGIIHSLPQLNQKDLIIDQANDMSDEMIGEMMEVLEVLDTEKVFVLLDAPTEVAKLKQRVRSRIIESEKENAAPAPARTEKAPVIRKTEPEPEEKRPEEPPVRRVVKVQKPLSFDGINVKRELTEQEFVRYAEYYANELECVIHDSGYDALQEEIDAIREEGGRLTAGEVQAIVEEAAEHAQKFSFKRIFASKYDKEGYLILRNRDFL